MVSSLVSSVFFRELDVHLLLLQAHLEGHNLILGLAPVLSGVLICQLEFLFCVGLYLALGISGLPFQFLLFNPQYTSSVILYVEAFDYLLLFSNHLKRSEKNFSMEFTSAVSSSFSLSTFWIWRGSSSK